MDSSLRMSVQTVCKRSADGLITDYGSVGGQGVDVVPPGSEGRWRGAEHLDLVQFGCPDYGRIR